MNWIAILAASRTYDPDIIIQAFRNQGYAIVPVEPTSSMVQAACDATFGPQPLSPMDAHVLGWRAMIAESEKSIL